VENALYADPRVCEVAAVGVPDERLGELVAAVVYVKPAFRGKISESELISTARKRSATTKNPCLSSTDGHGSLAKFAVPVMIIIRGTPFGKCVHHHLTTF